MIHSKLSKHIQVNPNAITLDYKNSKGSWIVDLEGKRRLDCFSQFSSQPLGWNHPKLLERRHRLNDVALFKTANSDCYTQEYCDFVEKFKSITPDFQYYFFISGGTLAVENALKAAFDWKLRRLKLDDFESRRLDVIHFENAFHGRSGYLLSLLNTHDVNKHKNYPKFNWTRVKKDSVGDIERVLAKQCVCGKEENGVAAIIIEPIQSEGGDNHFSKEFLCELRRLATVYNSMLIFDEVQTGLGMTGKMWCYEHFGCVPDMICFGKKTQVCGFAATSRIDEVKDNVFKVPSRICSTWGGSLIDMVRATIFLEIIEEDNLVENARVVGDYLLNGLQKSGLDNVRGRGLMVAWDLVSTQERDKFLNKLSENMLALPCGSKSIRLRPHLTFSMEDADQAIEFINKV